LDFGWVFRIHLDEVDNKIMLCSSLNGFYLLYYSRKTFQWLGEGGLEIWHWGRNIWGWNLNFIQMYDFGTLELEISAVQISSRFFSESPSNLCPQQSHPQIFLPQISVLCSDYICIFRQIFSFEETLLPQTQLVIF
jgi:hypothetical protein